MMSLLQTEKMIRLTLRSGDANFAMAYNKMLSYYAFFDFANSTNHCKIINMLYNFSKRRKAFKTIAYLTNVSDSTLLRNREQYVNCFNFYLNQKNQNAFKEVAFINDNKS